MRPASYVSCDLRPAGRDLTSASEEIMRARETLRPVASAKPSKPAQPPLDPGAPTCSMRPSARSCSGTCCGSAATSISSTWRSRRPTCCSSTPISWSMAAPCRGRSITAGADHAAARRHGRAAQAAVRGGRPARRPRPRHRRLQGRQRDRRRAGRRPPCYFIGFLPDPVPGQTIEDIMNAEAAFLRGWASCTPMPRASPW